MGKKYVAWSNKQKRVYQRLATWLTYFYSHGYQIFRIDLTSSKISDGEKMLQHFETLLRRIRRHFNYKCHFFYVQTNEGPKEGGVLHTCIAIENTTAAYIPQGWLSDNWQEIHGAFRVHINRMASNDHRKNALAYMVNQYLAGQDVIKRMGYSKKSLPFSIAKLWQNFKKTLHHQMPELWEEKVFGKIIIVREKLPSSVRNRLWNDLVSTGLFRVGDEIFSVVDGELKPTYKIVGTYEGSKEYEGDVPF